MSGLLHLQMYGPFFFYNSIILWVTHKDNRNKTADQYIVKFLCMLKIGFVKDYTKLLVIILSLLVVYAELILSYALFKILVPLLLLNSMQKTAKNRKL